LFIAVRTRFAEDELAASLERGVRQLVVLGAGLDTYAYRASSPHNLSVFEVDHPATQAWKRQRLAEVGIPVPSRLTFAPVDFEREALADGLMAAGFDPTQQTFFTWLGVVPYLTPQAVFSTLSFIARLPRGAHLVFDYSNPHDLSTSPDDNTTTRVALAERVASMGEPFKCFFETDVLHAKLTSLGFDPIEDLGPTLIRERYFFGQGTTSPERGGHLLRATVQPEFSRTPKTERSVQGKRTN
jgi:methyltransferase (TIGR00027 family)